LPLGRFCSRAFPPASAPSLPVGSVPFQGWLRALPEAEAPLDSESVGKPTTGDHSLIYPHGGDILQQGVTVMGLTATPPGLHLPALSESN